MDKPRFQFALTHLFVATAVIASFLAAVVSFGTFYETYKGVVSVGVVMLFFLLTVVIAICGASRQFRIPALLAFVILCIAFSVLQISNARRLSKLRAEVKNIVSYVEAYKRDRGAIPNDLSGYHYESPDLQECIKYRLDTQMSNYGYYIFFNPTGDTDYGHYYTRENGFWYEDD